MDVVAMAAMKSDDKPLDLGLISSFDSKGRGMSSNYG
jgi:hypothetical protein